MSVDLEQALGYEFKPVSNMLMRKRMSVYMPCQSGQATNPVDPEELKFVYELNGAGFFHLSDLCCHFSIFGDVGDFECTWPQV